MDRIRRGIRAAASAAVITAALLLVLAGQSLAQQDQVLTRMLLESAARNADRPALQTRAGKKEWTAIRYREWLARAEKLAVWLMAHGLEPGDRVGLLDHNNPEWAVVDLGVQLAGGVLVPFYPTLTGPQHNYILHDTGAKFFFVMDQVHLDPVRQLPDALGGVQVVGIFEPERWPEPSGSKLEEAGSTTPPTTWSEGVTVLRDILAGPEPTSEDRARIKARVQALRPDDVLTICYTSGTTSAPPAAGQTKVYPGKGVMLTHRNIASNVEGVIRSVAIRSDDVFLSVLPLAHMFERTAGYYVAMAGGATICYARSPKTFIEDISEVKPTVFACVPLLFERIYNAAFQKTSQKLIGKAIGGAKKAADWLGANEKKLHERIVGKFLHKALGGRVRFAVSGGAALKRELADFFLQNVGITVLEGYGLTETAPVLTCNRPEAFRFGTVGTPIPGVEIRLAEDAEILAKGPNIMKGYLNLPEETAKAIDQDGWFHTGDLGAWDIHGFLKIVGRKKLLFKLKTGKYISPETIENRMVHALVAHSMVVGENQDYAAALIFPELAALRHKAAAMGIQGDDAALCANPQVIAVYQKLVDEALAGLASFEKIKKFVLVPHTLTVEAGELTPTMKLKRGVVAEKFAAQIGGLFQ